MVEYMSQLYGKCRFVVSLKLAGIKFCDQFLEMDECLSEVEYNSGGLHNFPVSQW